jgi:hypothetical protein
MPDVEIRDLVLKLPGVSRDEARAIAEEVAERLAATGPSWRDGDASAHVAVRVRMPDGVRRHEIAAVVAAQVARALR